MEIKDFISVVYENEMADNGSGRKLVCITTPSENLISYEVSRKNRFTMTFDSLDEAVNFYNTAQD